MNKIEATPGKIMTLARWMAQQKAKAEMRKAGIKPAYAERRVLARATREWLVLHERELVVAARVMLGADQALEPMMDPE